MEKARIAFRFGHYGDCFHGSQVQPDVPTVQGTLMHIFKKKLKWTEERMPVAMASRTDAGVHVRLNGAYIDIDLSLIQDKMECDERNWVFESCRPPNSSIYFSF